MAPPVYGMRRKATRKERLRWDVYFTAPVPVSERAGMLAELRHVEARWDLDRVLTLTWDGTPKVSTALFRDQVASRLEGWEALAPIAAAHFCFDGPWRESRARARASAGLPAYFFPFLNHNRRPPRHLWRVSLLCEDPSKREAPVWFRKVGFRLLGSGPWLRFQHRHGLDPIPRALAEILDQLDAALEELHEVNPITLAIFGPSRVLDSDDHWHTWSVERAQSIAWALPDDASFAPLFESSEAPLDPAALAELMAEARASFEHAEDQGDPASALEGVLDVLERLPRVHAAERRQVEAWAGELAAILAE